MSFNKVAVTGGCGFIGSAVVRAMTTSGCEVLNIDSLTYAASPGRLAGVSGARHVKLDVRDGAIVDELLSFAPDAIVHTAAETHVTRSEKEPDLFFSVNVEGTRNLTAAASEVGALLVHVSTDEVYGPSSGYPFSEEEKLPGEGSATSAYARSKALADDVAREAAAHQPVIVVRPTNCFGPWQNPEKAIPRWITRALGDLPLPVWGDGRYVRDWMFVDDAADGILKVMNDGVPGQVYNLGPGDSSVTNFEIARMIVRLAERSESLVTLTEYDRPDHDRKYCVDVTRIRSLGWNGGREIHDALAETVNWYRLNESWWAPLFEESEGLYADHAPRKP